MLVGIVALIVIDPSPKRREAPVSEAAPQVYRPPKLLRMTPKLQRTVDETIDDFVRSAVLRGDLDAAWRLSTDNLHGAGTRAEWMRGDLPLASFPADVRRTTWFVDYAYEDELALFVSVLPRSGYKVPAEVYAVSMKPVGSGESRRWLIDSWYTRDVVSEPAFAPPAPDIESTRTVASPYSEGQIDARWWLAPISILLLILFVPTGVLGYQWWRGRRAERAFRRGS